MEWLQTSLNGDNGTALQLILITLLVVICLVLIVWIFRKFIGTPARRAARNRVPRLSVTDISVVDEKRFLVLVRRDNVEHLLLIGGQSDIVVESGIVRVQPNTQPSQIEGGQIVGENVQQKEVNTQNVPESAVANTATVAAVTTSNMMASEQSQSDKTQFAPSVELQSPKVTTENDSEQRSVQLDGPAAEVSVASTSSPSGKEQNISQVEEIIRAELQETDNNPQNDAPLADENVDTARQSETEDLQGKASTQTGPDNLDAEILQRLNGALAEENIKVNMSERSEQVSQDTNTNDASAAASVKEKDDMQRLLEELAAETKTS